jgi:hypothetical protein
MKPKYKFVTLINLSDKQVEEKLNEGWILNNINVFHNSNFIKKGQVILREFYFIKPELEDVNPNIYYRKSDFNTEL